MDTKDFKKLLEQEKREQEEFKTKFNTTRGSMEEKLFLVGASCFSESRLVFFDLERFQDILTEEEMLSLIRFKNKILRNNECLGYAKDVISPLFRDLNSLDYAYFINLNRENGMFEFCQIYYSIFQKFSNSKLKKSEQTVSSFGKLHDYRNALNHNPIDRTGWLYPKGTRLEEINFTQQEAINELSAMLRLAETK